MDGSAVLDNKYTRGEVLSPSTEDSIRASVLFNTKGWFSGWVVVLKGSVHFLLFCF